VTPSYKELKLKHRNVRDQFPESLSVRVHRALSWLDRSEMETEDFDSKFIFLWISFNAAYAQEFEGVESFTQQELLGGFIERIVSNDKRKLIYNLLWHQFSGPIRTLINNQYVFQPYWSYLKGQRTESEWKESFLKAKQAANICLAEDNTTVLLQIVLSRLYVLRNQMLHGLATWNGKVNRDQLRDGTAILERLVPIIIDLMMDDPHRNWGDHAYPVISN
jgi:hypothetical protein